MRSSRRHTTVRRYAIRERPTTTYNVASWCRATRRYGPSCRAAPIWSFAPKASAAFSSSAPGPAWPSVAFPSGSPRRSCTTCWSGSSRSSPPSRVILWAWDSRRISCRRWNDRLPGPDRRLDRDLLFHADPPAAPAAGAAPAAARVAATGRSHRHLGGHHRRGRAPEGRRSHGEERGVALDRAARQHREHPEPLGRGRQAAVTIRQLHLLGSPVLRQRSTAVAAVDDTVRRLVDDLFETMHAAKGVGLAANQIGVARRVAVVDVGEDAPPPLVLINPRIVPASELQETAEEGCLSIPDVYGEVERPLSIALEALDRDGRPYKVELSGFKARAVQHEIDHLDGVLFLDHLSAVKRGLLLAKWKKSRKGQSGYVKDVTPEPAGEL